MTRPGESAVVEWAWAGAALEGEERSGDAHVVAHVPDGAVVAVIDGLGHGREAAAAAEEAARQVEALAGEPLEVIVERCHQALRQTRGAVMTLASFDVRHDTMTWLAVGNVEAVLLRWPPPEGRRESITPRGGVVGYHLPRLRAATVPVSRGDMLVMATDGIRAAFVDGLTARDEPAKLARSVHVRHARGSDDALVLAARFVGKPG